MGPSIIQELLEAGHRFDFFQAVRLLEENHKDREAIGGDASPEREIVRFVPFLSLAFPASAIQEIEPDEIEGRLRMVVNFMGFYGTQGVLPRHYTELLLERAKAGDHGLRSFLDIFNHRFISLFFRANEKHRYTSVSRRSPDDPITQAVGRFLGDEVHETTEESDIPRRHLLRYVGLFSQRPRSVKALEAITSDYFGGVPVQVRQFQGRWVFLAEDDQGQLSDSHGTNQLGRTMVIGGRTWDRKGKFRLRIGPLGLEAYLEFQPGGRCYRALCSLVRLFVGDHLTFDIQPVLRAPEIPGLKLSTEPWPPVRLGRTTWLLTRPRILDADDAAFECQPDLNVRIEGVGLA